MNPFKKKSRTEQIEEYAEDIVKELFISKFTYEEIAMIANLIKPKIKHRLEERDKALDERQKELDLQQLELTNAKNLL